MQEKLLSTLEEQQSIIDTMANVSANIPVLLCYYYLQDIVNFQQENALLRSQLEQQMSHSTALEVIF